MYSKSHYIHERKTPSVPIKIQSTYMNVNDTPKAEYSLKQTFFDPSKSSPPNEFLLKLQMRMDMYNKNSNHIKDDSREIE